MTELAFKKYLVNELARKQIKITQEVFDQINDYLLTEGGQIAFEQFKQTDLAKILNKNKYQGFKSDLRKMSEDVPTELIKD